MRRRDFITLASTAAVAWPLTARAQQAALPVVGVVSGQSPHSDALNATAFYKGRQSQSHGGGKPLVAYRARSE